MCNVSRRSSPTYAQDTGRERSRIHNRTVANSPVQAARTLESLKAGSNAGPSGAWQREMLEKINDLRREYGLHALSWNSSLENIAERWSGVMSRTSMHHQKMGGELRAENVAFGYRTPEDVLQGWLNSPGHRKNILSPTVTEIGVGRVANFWTMDFG